MIEIKTDDGKGVKARAIVGNTSRCGHCDMILLDGQTFFMLDEPYACIVHETCLNFFAFDGKHRCAEAPQNQERQKAASDDEQTLANYMSRGHWKVLRIPRAVRDAIVRMYFMCLVLRQNYIPTPKRADILNKVIRALDLFKENGSNASVPVSKLATTCSGGSTSCADVEEAVAVSEKVTLEAKPVGAKRERTQHEAQPHEAEPQELESTPATASATAETRAEEALLAPEAVADDATPSGPSRPFAP